MLKNYIKIGWRNILKSPGYSFINISGLAVGMAVAITICLWIWDELSFDRYHADYNRIALVMQNQDFNGVTSTQAAIPYPLGDALRAKYGTEFKYVVMSSWTNSHVITYGDKKLSELGIYMEPDGPELFDFKMISGSKKGLADPSSVMLSRSAAKAIFGDADALGKMLEIDNRLFVTVTGVYEDPPSNSTFHGLSFISTWSLYTSSEKWIQESTQEWGSNSFQTFVRIPDRADFDQISAKIRNIKYDAVDQKDKRYHPEMFLYPMSKWHLYDEFKDGKISGGRVQFVWLFGIIGIFVLMLACINFMNISTARSEKRAKEVGVRKTFGSLRSQLIWQFFSESLLIVSLAFIVSVLIVQLSLPWFNSIAGKELSILWSKPVFWAGSITFILITGIIAGSYPALYLSSFQPVKVLKGTFKTGRFASVPRKILVVLQFSVSIILVIGTIVVFRQIQFAKDRPVGYNREGLIMSELITDDIHNHFDAFRHDMIRSGSVEDVAESQSPVTAVWASNSNFRWQGKDPSLNVDFATSGVSHEFGKTVGWEFALGRDFSRSLASDSTSAFVINEAAAKFMNLKSPVGEMVKWGNKDYKIVGVIKNMVMESPYGLSRPTFFFVSQRPQNVVIIRMKPGTSIRKSLSTIESVFKKYSPSTPFKYTFVDEDYAAKFTNEKRIGKLATLFAFLAIFISCLGLFGMAAFTAEQRTKEIGVRKVLGATITNLWGMLSMEFVMLVFISCLIASPIAWWFLNHWLQNYTYRTELSWWIFALVIIGALLITLFTVSFQAIKAALMNPVRSLRSE